MFLSQPKATTDDGDGALVDHLELHQLTDVQLEQRYNQALINGANALSKRCAFADLHQRELPLRSWSKVTTFKMRDLVYDTIYNPQTYGFTGACPRLASLSAQSDAHVVGMNACTDGTTSNVCANPQDHVFWGTRLFLRYSPCLLLAPDTLHPTTKWHQQISQRILNLL